MAREQCRLVVFNSHERQGIETFIIRRPQILSVEIPGPKLVLLSKFSFSLTSLMDDPVLSIYNNQD